MFLPSFPSRFLFQDPSVGNQQQCQRGVSLHSVLFARKWTLFTPAFPKPLRGVAFKAALPFSYLYVLWPKGVPFLLQPPRRAPEVPTTVLCVTAISHLERRWDNPAFTTDATWPILWPLLSYHRQSRGQVSQDETLLLFTLTHFKVVGASLFSHHGPSHLLWGGSQSHSLHSHWWMARRGRVQISSLQIKKLALGFTTMSLLPKLILGLMIDKPTQECRKREIVIERECSVAVYPLLIFQKKKKSTST